MSVAERAETTKAEALQPVSKFLGEIWASENGGCNWSDRERGLFFDALNALNRFLHAEDKQVA